MSCREYATPPSTRVVQRGGCRVVVLGYASSTYGGAGVIIRMPKVLPALVRLAELTTLLKGNRDNVTSRTQAPHHHEDSPKGKSVKW
jgi:hypothetical protein